MNLGTLRLETKWNLIAHSLETFQKTILLIFFFVRQLLQKKIIKKFLFQHCILTIFRRWKIVHLILMPFSVKATVCAGITCTKVQSLINTRSQRSHLAAEFEKNWLSELNQLKIQNCLKLTKWFHQQCLRLDGAPLPIWTMTISLWILHLTEPILLLPARLNPSQNGASFVGWISRLKVARIDQHQTLIFALHKPLFSWQSSVYITDSC